MARHDVPANIDYVRNATGATSVTYFAWSQGCTQMFIAAATQPGLASKVKLFIAAATQPGLASKVKLFIAAATQPGLASKVKLFIAAATQPGLASKVKLFIGLSPVTYMKHQQSTLLGLLSKSGIAAAINAAFPYGFLEGGEGMSTFIKIVCELTLGAICKFSGNEIAYQQPLPPPYTLSRLTIPTALFLRVLGAWKGSTGERATTTWRRDRKDDLVEKDDIDHALAERAFLLQDADVGRTLRDLASG
eukprot:gene51337-14394_t